MVLNPNVFIVEYVWGSSCFNTDFHGLSKEWNVTWQQMEETCHWLIFQQSPMLESELLKTTNANTAEAILCLWIHLWMKTANYVLHQIDCSCKHFQKHIPWYCKFSVLLVNDKQVTSYCTWFCYFKVPFPTVGQYFYVDVQSWLYYFTDWQ